MKEIDRYVMFGREVVVYDTGPDSCKLPIPLDEYWYGQRHRLRYIIGPEFGSAPDLPNPERVKYPVLIKPIFPPVPLVAPGERISPEVSYYREEWRKHEVAFGSDRKMYRWWIWRLEGAK